MSSWSREKYVKAYRFAAEAHRGQIIPESDHPYIVHPTLVSMEVISVLSIESGWDGDLALQAALLHDVLEDTPHRFEEIRSQFGNAVADGVLAMTKDQNIRNGERRIIESLNRIRRQPWEIWLVKMADRITNLSPPPASWSEARIADYRKESLLIYRSLGKANPFLARRLSRKIASYPPKPAVQRIPKTAGLRV